MKNDDFDETVKTGEEGEPNAKEDVEREVELTKNSTGDLEKELEKELERLCINPTCWANSQSPTCLVNGELPMFLQELKKSGVAV